MANKLHKLFLEKLFDYLKAFFLERIRTQVFKQFHHRSYELEHLDKGDYLPQEYDECLCELRFVNRYLGDQRALRVSLIEELKQSQKSHFSVLDVGAGSGYLLRVVAEWAQRCNKKAHLVGVELNERAALAMKEEFSEIEVVRADALHLPFKDKAFDYAICSLFLHHFRDEEAIFVLNEMAQVARRIIVIDLHRHWLAYYLYVTGGRLILRNRLVREDGALSIRRGFRPAELIKLTERAGLRLIQVKRSFPFRLILIAENTKSEGVSHV